eukprot:TRINITY_DN3588_c2_g1_i1.p2 TRINITY_DN3588_c2_g1~~TRINITY_DN3588_c2_g1_i1.p2  ORF type:complete len:127 (+),score=11.80 TRINITY_DN3588_c2_g1_i1:2-382(+)
MLIGGYKSVDGGVMKTYSNMLKNRVCQVSCTNKQTHYKTSAVAITTPPPTGSIAKAEYFVYPENVVNLSEFSRQPMIVGVAGGTGSGKNMQQQLVLEMNTNHCATQVDSTRDSASRQSTIGRARLF